MSDRLGKIGIIAFACGGVLAVFGQIDQSVNSGNLQGIIVSVMGVCFIVGIGLLTICVLKELS